MTMKTELGCERRTSFVICHLSESCICVLVIGQHRVGFRGMAGLFKCISRIGMEH